MIPLNAEEKRLDLILRNRPNDRSRELVKYEDFYVVCDDGGGFQFKTLAEVKEFFGLEQWGAT